MGGSYFGMVEQGMKRAKPHLLICTPTHGQTVAVPYLVSMLKLVERLCVEQIPWEIKLNSNGCVDDARNDCVFEFRNRPEFTHMLFVDGDVGFEPESVFTLLGHGEAIVGACYPRREFPITYAINIGARVKNKRGCILVEGSPAGFLLIRRDAINTIWNAHPERRHFIRNKEHRRLFEHWIFNGRRFSEDITFIRRARACGIKCWIDPTIRLTHTGDYTWSGALVDELNGMPFDTPHAKAKRGRKTICVNS